MPILAELSKRGQPVVLWFETTPPILIFSGLAFVGICLTLVSMGLHLDSVNFAAVGKRLGYLNEINWSVNFSFVVPVAAFFAFASLNNVSQVVRNLSASKMLIREDGVALNDRDLLEHYHRMAGVAVFVGLLLSVLAFVVSWREWYVDCMFAWDPSRGVDGTKDLLMGWNLAPTVPGSQATLSANRVFGFCAFTMQAVAGAVFLLFCTMVVTFAAWIYHFTSEQVGDDLVPDVRSPDERRGFEHFEPFLRNILFASLFFFGVFFLTRLNGAYVLSDSKTLWQFIRSDVFFGFASAQGGLFKNPSQLLYAGPDITKPIVTVGLGMGLTLVLAFLVPVVIVGLSASDSRSRARVEPIRSILRERANFTDEQFDKALDRMAIWPLKYPGPVELLSFLVVAGTCFVFYRLTLVLVGLVIAASLKRVVKILSGKV